jgi:hypothetical protein
MAKGIFLNSYVNNQRTFKRFLTKRRTLAGRAIKAISMFNREIDIDRNLKEGEFNSDSILRNYFNKNKRVVHPNTNMGRIVSLNSKDFNKEEFDSFIPKKKISSEDYFK